jgi:hypothetical protein
MMEAFLFSDIRHSTLQRKTIMIKHEENKLTMYLGVKSVLEKNASRTDTMPALGASVAQFASTIEAIQGKAQEFDLAVTGKTQTKQDAEEDLIDELMPAVAALAAYAHSRRDSELLEKAALTVTAIRRLQDTEVVTKANGVLDLLQAQASKLADFGVGADTIANLKSRIEGYAAALAQKESGYSERVGMREALTDLFDEADTVLSKQIDTLMQHFRKRDTEFYNAYFGARSIRDLGERRKEKGAPGGPVD